MTLLASLNLKVTRITLPEIYLLKSFVEILGSSIFLSFDKYRYRIAIDTGATGKCRLCIYVPKNVGSCQGPLGVVMYMHGGGWAV